MIGWQIEKECDLTLSITRSVEQSGTFMANLFFMYTYLPKHVCVYIYGMTEKLKTLGVTGWLSQSTN